MYSFSKLSCYESCPRQYYWKYVKKIPDKPTDAMKFGKQFHEFAELFHRNMRLDSVKRISDLDVLKNGIKEMDKFVEYEKKRLRALRDVKRKELFKPVLIEGKLIGEIAGSEFIGYVDRVDELCSGEYCVVDYKTTKPWNKMGKTKLKRQLAIYTELLEQQHGIEATHVGAYFYKTGGDCFKKQHVQTVKAMERWVSSVVNNIETEENYWPRKIDCNQCSYKEICWKLPDMVEIS